MAELTRPPQQRLADVAGVRYRAASSRGKVAEWRAQSRTLTLQEEPVFGESFREFKAPALRLVIDLREGDKSVLPPEANPIFIANLPPEWAELPDDEVLDLMMARLAVSLGPQRERSR